MRKSLKIAVGVAFAGLAAAGGTALTGTGLTNSAGPYQFIGGQVSQTVTGATLTNVAYTYLPDGSNTAVSGITLTFSNDTPATAVVTVQPLGGSGSFSCGALVANTDNSAYTSTCTDDAGYVGLTSLGVTVAPATS